jgi:hypothetical protein
MHEERFASKVDRNGPIPDGCHDLGPCHVWTGGLFSRGYGSFWFQGKNHKAHRVAFFLAHGRWPEPFCCHHCDNPACVNPDHLFEGTDADNAADRDAKGRQRTPLGELHANSKLTRQAVIDIRAAHAAGVSQRELGRRYGVASTTIHSVVRGEIWNHV